MAGIYIHIPFCKSRCIYCGFFSTTSLVMRDAYIETVCRELSSRKDYLKGVNVETIYFGGGTPSQLGPSQICKILDTIYNIYGVCNDAEITLEGNPDDLSPDYLRELKSVGINRLSMGVQSFDDNRLRFIHRRHSSRQALKAVGDAASLGFDNISIDLMYGFPSQSLDSWKEDVTKAVTLPVQHISAYSLMYEEGTLLEKMLSEGRVEEADEELSLEMYKHLVSKLSSVGFEHYEVSNFARKGFRSRHNSSYWRGVPYLGVGAGAHSFDGASRGVNVESLTSYLAGAELIVEELTQAERYNEYVFTGLRTAEGISLESLQTTFGTEFYDYFLLNAGKHLLYGLLEQYESDSCPRVRLTSEGVFVSNDVMSDLMYAD